MELQLFHLRDGDINTARHRGLHPCRCLLCDLTPKRCFSYSDLRCPLRWNHSSHEQAGSHSSSISHPAQRSGTRSEHSVRPQSSRGGRVDEPFGSSRQLSITLLGVAGRRGSRVLYPPTPRTVPKRCTSSGVGAASCPPGRPYLTGPDQPPPPAQVREAGGAGGAVGRLDTHVVQLWADCRMEGKKASFLEKSMDRGQPPSHNLHGSQPRKQKIPEKWAPLTAAER